jgi:pimeloyl-ACP methyl ester carboxylesterase
MKKSILFILTTLALSAASAQPPATAQPPTSSQPPASAQRAYQQAAARFRDLFNGQQGDSLFVLLSPRVKAILPLDKTKQMLTQLYSQFGMLKSTEFIRQDTNVASYKASFDKIVLTMGLALDRQGMIDGLHFRPYEPPSPPPSSAPSSFPRSSAASSSPSSAELSPPPSIAASSHPPPPDGSDIFLKTPQGKIDGTLVLPRRDKKVPVVLIIAGSGATDRNGNDIMMGLNSNIYQILADSLSRQGIASVRYDKRGVGASMAVLKSESDLTIEDFIGDAVGFIKILQADPRFSKVIVLGHSEGSLLGMIAAARTHADGYISVAGAGDRIDKVLESQLAAKSASVAAAATVLFDSLSRGYTVQEPRNELMALALFRPSIQPYLISWLRYNPQQEIRRLRMPTLIIQGTTDLQVSVHDAELLKQAKPNATLLLINHMNHIFRAAGADQHENLATYEDPSLPLHPEFLAAIETFITSAPSAATAPISTPR